MQSVQDIRIETNVALYITLYQKIGNHGITYKKFNMTPMSAGVIPAVIVDDKTLPFEITALQHNGIVDLQGRDFTTRISTTRNVALPLSAFVLAHKPIDDGLTKAYVDGALYAARFEHPCEHVWIITQGFTNAYEDCKHCGIKKEDLSNTYTLDLK